jgi:hypothetical protein
MHPGESIPQILKITPLVLLVLLLAFILGTIISAVFFSPVEL